MISVHSTSILRSTVSSLLQLLFVIRYSCMRERFHYDILNLHRRFVHSIKLKTRRGASNSFTFAFKYYTPRTGRDASTAERTSQIPSRQIISLRRYWMKSTPEDNRDTGMDRPSSFIASIAQHRKYQRIKSALRSVQVYFATRALVAAHEAA